MQTFSDLIDAFGDEALAAALGVPESHVRTMKARGSIATAYWAALIAGAPEPLKPQLTFESLSVMRARRFAKATA